MPTTTSRLLLEWLRTHKTDALPEKLVPGASEAELRSLAALGGVVRSLIADRVAKWDVDPDLARWWEDAPEAPANVVDAARQLIAEGGDVGLGNLYSQLVRADHRRHLGTFFTPPNEVAWMLSRWVKTQVDPATVVDVGAGVGIFTAAASSRWPMARIWAIDVNPVTLGLLAARVAPDFPVRSARSTKSGIRLIARDYVAWAQETWDELPAARLILGNPPYTRLQLLPMEDRLRLAASAGGLCGSRASLSSLITASTLRLLEPKDGLCLLLPAQWLESQYAVGLREHLWGLRRRRVEMRLFDALVFDDARVDAVALLVGTERDRNQPFRVVGADGEPHEIARTGTCPANWRTTFFTAGRARTQVAPGDTTDAVTLGDLAVVRRGAATGNNHFFVLSEQQRRETSMPRRLLRPTARRLRDFSSVVSDQALSGLSDCTRRWMLVVTKLDRRPGSALDRYLKVGEAAGIPDRELCRNRRVWFELGSEVLMPEVIVGAMSQGKFAFVENTAGAAITNNLYGLRWRENVTAKRRREVLVWLRSEEGQSRVADIARAQAARLKKVELSALQGLRLPARFGPGSKGRRQPRHKGSRG